MAVDLLPLATWSDEDERFVPIGLHLLPEYYAREAARFAGYRWGEWVKEKPGIRNSVAAHWFAHRLYTAHESDATALREEEDARREAQQAKVSRG